MNSAGTATLGDFGAGGPRSDVLIDKQSAAQEAAIGKWQFLAVGNDTTGWHIPETGATLLLKGGDGGWTLERATKLVGTRSSLDAGLDLVSTYMANRPEGASKWR